MISEQESMGEKLDTLEEELKSLGLWQKAVPLWINNYEDIDLVTVYDFTTWLQFVFIPNQRNLQTSKAGAPKNYHLVPSALQFFGNQINNGKLLQILIEIDATI